MTKEKSDKVTIPIRIKKDSLQRFRVLAATEKLRSPNEKIAKVAEAFISAWEGAIDVKPDENNANTKQGGRNVETKTN